MTSTRGARRQPEALRSLVTGLGSEVSASDTRSLPTLPTRPSSLLSLTFLAAERCSFKAGVEEDPPPKVASSLVVGALSWDVGDVGLGPSG